MTRARDADYYPYAVYKLIVNAELIVIADSADGLCAVNVQLCICPQRIFSDGSQKMFLEELTYCSRVSEIMQNVNTVAYDSRES
jgi:hypothetical protein